MVLLVLAVVAAVTAAALAFRPAHQAASHASQTPSASHSAARAVPILTPVSAQGLDETSVNANMAIDGSSHTAWQTQFYKAIRCSAVSRRGPGSSWTWATRCG